jgi:hypothetical protein
VNCECSFSRTFLTAFNSITERSGEASGRWMVDGGRTADGKVPSGSGKVRVEYVGPERATAILSAASAGR